MNRLFTFIGLIILFSSCNDKEDKSLSEFENNLDIVLDRRIRDFKYHQAINGPRFNSNYDYFLSYFEISERIKGQIHDYKDLAKTNNISMINRDVDSLVDRTSLIYRLITDSYDDWAGWYDYEMRYIEGLFNSLKGKISKCKSIRDIQDFNIMLYQLDLYIVDFLSNQPEYGLFKFSEITGPIMVTKRDSVFFYLTAYDSTITDFIIIGDFEIRQGESGNYFITDRFDEEVYFNDFSIGLPKDRVIDKEFLYVTVGPAGDTIRRPIKR